MKSPRLPRFLCGTFKNAKKFFSSRGDTVEGGTKQNSVGQTSLLHEQSEFVLIVFCLCIYRNKIIVAPRCVGSCLKNFHFVRVQIHEITQIYLTSTNGCLLNPFTARHWTTFTTTSFPGFFFFPSSGAVNGQLTPVQLRFAIRDTLKPNLP